MNKIRRTNRFTLAAGSAALLCVGLALPANAAVILVDNTCTLSDAIESANDNISVGGCTAGDPLGSDFIVLTQDVEVTVASDPLRGEGLPVITSDINILGLGHSVTRNSVDSFRIFTIGALGVPATVYIQNTTISGGSTTQEANPGGGIYVEGGSFLYLVRCTVSGNSAQFGGGIFNAGTVDIDKSLVTQNTAVQSGAGLETEWVAAIYNSTFSGNTLTAAAADAGIAVNSVEQNAGVGVALSTFSGNSSNSTSSSTLKGVAGSVNVGESIIANTVGGGVACLGTFDQLLNKDDDGTCGGGGDLTGLDPVLADNGGPTQTHALLESSNAIDHAGDCGELQDQRGSLREQNLCDSGAYERSFSCTAPDGDTLLLEMGTVTGVELFEVCTTITAQNNYTVMGPNGDLTLRAGASVILGNGFSVTVGGKLTVDIDPDLQLKTDAP